MIARVSARAVRCASLLAVVLSFTTLLHAQKAEIHSLQSRLDFGVTSPEEGREARTMLSLMVTSPQPWSLSAAATNRVGDPTADHALRIRDAQGNWHPLTATLRVPLAAGAPTSIAGQVLTLQIEITPGWNDAPGPREVDLRFSLDDGTATDDVRVAYRIEPATLLEMTPREYSVTVPDPSTPGLVPFDIATYRVMSNVPWRLTARLDDVPRVTGSNTSLGPDAVVVKVDRAKWLPVPVAAAGITVTTGTQTGSAGASAQVEFALRTKASEIGGRYSAPLEVVAEPLAGSAK